MLSKSKHCITCKIKFQCIVSKVLQISILRAILPPTRKLDCVETLRSNGHAISNILAQKELKLILGEKRKTYVSQLFDNELCDWLEYKVS